MTEGNVYVGVALIAVLLSFEVFVMWRYPDFRRALLRHYSAEQIGKRLQELAKRLDERSGKR